MSNMSLLDSPQVIKYVYDEASNSIRVNIGDVNGFSFSLNASGDTIGTQGVSSSTKVSLTTSSSGTVIPAVSCVGMKSFQLYTNTTATLTGAQVLTLQVSPSDTDDIWISTSLTVTESGTSGTVVMGTVNSGIVARRARVIIASTISTGTFDTYLVMQGC